MSLIMTVVIALAVIVLYAMLGIGTWVSKLTTPG